MGAEGSSTDLATQPFMPDQELNTATATYWEGSYSKVPGNVIPQGRGMWES